MLALIDPLFTDHDPGAGHPERPERISTLLHMLEKFPARGEIQFVAPRRGMWDEAAWVHSRDYLEQLKQSSGSRVILDQDTRTSPDSIETALAAAGSVLAVAEKVNATAKTGFAMIRPPGHHAERDRAMGFCFLNNVAVAAEWALRRAGAQRVAIIDFDVHHGNGTQHSFYDRNDVLYISSHQFPYYPGTGAFEEIGVGKGRGFTVNFPLKAGTGDGVFTRIYEDLVPAILEQYQPDWLFISAGYDAHRDDPLAQLEISEQGFARVVQSLQRCGRQLCQGKAVYVLEGGYNLEALAASVRTSLEVILGKLGPSGEPIPEPEGWRQYLAAVRGV